MIIILFPIIGMAELLLEDLPANLPEHENAKEILCAGKRGSDLVKQILAFSRQSEQKMMPIRVQSILKEVIKLCRAAIPSNIVISQDIQTKCSNVYADPTQLHQVVMNLITNAYHAIDPAGGRIEIMLKETELSPNDIPESFLKPGKYALIVVSDTGCGIEPGIMNKIYDPYFTTKEQGKGTGLGLSVVYGIVKEHKGDIKVYSELGKGTTFKIYLPVIEKTPVQDSMEKNVAPAAGSERILLVDDEEPIVQLEKMMLERLGYHVTEKTTSVDALKAFQSSPDAFDLVITDMNMPDITGDRLAGKLISIRPDLPVILCTGFSERINSDATEVIGIKGFLMKPIVRSELAATVRKVLDASKNVL